VVPAKTTTSAAAKPAAPAGGKTHWFVQVGAFNDIAKAHQVLDKLSPKGLKGIISPLDSAKGTLYRARIGPLASRDQAKQAQDQAAKLGFAGSSLIED
jgi:DedD protein